MGGGLNYDLYEHCLHDSKTDIRMYKRREQVKINIYITYIYIWGPNGWARSVGVGVGEKCFKEIELGHSDDI